MTIIKHIVHLKKIYKEKANIKLANGLVVRKKDDRNKKTRH